LTPFVNWARGGGSICGGDNCEGTELEAIVATMSVTGGHIPLFDEILSCGTAAGGCIFFIWVCTEIGIPFIIGIPT
jgi:hypothetical protein